MFTLWRYNAVTGYWAHVRQCAEDTAADWLRIFEQDEPAARFYLTRGHKPKHDPIARDRSHLLTMGARTQ